METDQYSSVSMMTRLR